MRIFRSSDCLLILVCVTTGCSQTGGVRPNSGSSTRTVASVGDKPLPVVAGEPGSSLRASTEELDLPSSTGSRISGRVFDESGKPVSNAKVRLAVGSSPGGKINYTMTVPSGAFTLRGLRANSTYTVIAEYQGEDGVMTGRVEAEAPSTNVRISLQPRDAYSGQNRAAIRPARPRVEPISNAESGEDEHAIGSGNARNKNEDIEPPDEEAAALPRKSNLRIARVSSDLSSSPVRAGWSVRQQSTQNDDRTASKPSTRNDRAESTSRGKVPDDSAPEVDDDGPNPLPPAIEADPASSAYRGEVNNENPIKIARGKSLSPSLSNQRSVPATLDPADPSANDQADQSAEQEPRPIPEEILPRGRANAPEPYEPTIVIGGVETDGTPVRSSKPTQRTTTKSSSGSRSSNSSTDSDSTNAPDSPDPNSSAKPRPRPTWRQLSFQRAAVPLDESIRRTAGDGDASPNNKRVITLTSASQPVKPRLSRLLGGARPPLDAAVTQTVCQIDPAEGRLVDFQLPGLDGKMVSLHEIDADVVLLDFWGSWCKQCKESIPHLGELQTKWPGKRLQVVGIACEKGASIQDRRASAAKAAQDLGIKYPVLVSSMDGSCPVQKGLQIKFYPTMLLLDRTGRLLGREQGATQITLARMDQAVDSALGDHAARMEDEGVGR
jgi:thiol-disulfide isomerase/thioredoxin